MTGYNTCSELSTKRMPHGYDDCPAVPTDSQAPARRPVATSPLLTAGPPWPHGCRQRRAQVMPSPSSCRKNHPPRHPFPATDLIAETAGCSGRGGGSVATGRRCGYPFPPYDRPTMATGLPAVANRSEAV